MTARHVKTPHPRRTRRQPTEPAAPDPALDPSTPLDNTGDHAVGEPQFAQPVPTPDPGKFAVVHGSDTAAYRILDHEPQTPLPFPAARGGTEPVLGFEAVWGSDGKRIAGEVDSADLLVFHAVGDTGNTRTTVPQNLVSDKLAEDFIEADKKDVPKFFFHLGDVIYNFGEAQYYYDQFYEPYRNYPAPILALAGNHDGMLAPNVTVRTLDAFLRNFCADPAEKPHITPEAGGLDRTAQIQPGVYFTFEAPLVRILALYSGTLEDPGVISSQGGQFPDLPDIQLDYLRAALNRIKTENYPGAVIIAHHHPVYTAGSRHGSSPLMQKDIDAVCADIGIWPHAVLSAHAHNYQRFTRNHANRQIPYVVAGGGGHGVNKLMSKGADVLRVPQAIQLPAGDRDQVVIENYDDTDYGYLRILVTSKQLRIEYHAAVPGQVVKAPDDFVTVDLATGTIGHWAG